jgi:hypothetical protein
MGARPVARALATLATGALLAAASPPAAAQTAPAQVPSLPLTDESWFFSQTAASGTLGTGRLVLSGVSPSVLEVSDRPAREVRRTALGTFAADWPARFGAEAPNAVLTAVVDGREQSTTLVLSDPSVDAAAGRLAYAAATVDGSPLPSWQFGLATVSIDAATPVVYRIQISDTSGTEIAALVTALLADRRVTVAAGATGMPGVHTEADPQLGGNLSVVNLLRQEIRVRVERGGQTLAEDRLISGESLEWRPPNIRGG